MKRPIIRIIITMIISICIVLLSSFIHEVGHWIGSMMFYHTNGTLTLFYFYPNSNVGIYCYMMGGLLATICVLPFVFLKTNPMIRLTLLLTLFTHLVAFVIEGFINSYYNTKPFLIIGIILLLAFSGLYIWNNRKLFLNMLNVESCR